MAERAKLGQCPFCGSDVTADYIGSSDWEIVHVKNGVRNDEHGCIDHTIWARASSAQWDADDNAEWNMMAERWNRRQMQGRR